MIKIFDFCEQTHGFARAGRRQYELSIFAGNDGFDLLTIKWKTATKQRAFARPTQKMPIMELAQDFGDASRTMHAGFSPGNIVIFACHTGKYKDFFNN